MTVKFEVKGMLAKLLATEDLIIEHKNVETACFNVHTRCLTLPNWEKASNTVYDLLCLHEISHALWTPDFDWEQEYKIPQQFVNIVEDARVEKLCKRKYAGSPKVFFNGYKELHTDDFFQLADEDISKFNLADRVNLYYKIGNFLSMDFTPEEKEIVDLIGVAETFADALIAAEELYKYCKKEQQQQQKVNNFDSHQKGDSTSASSELSEESSNDQQDGETNESQSSTYSESNENSGKPQGEHQTNNGSDNQDSEPDVQTMNNFESKIKDLVNSNGSDNVYLEIPQVNLDTVIAKNIDVHKHINTFFAKQQERYGESGNEGSIFKVIDTEYKQFKNSAQKEVNYLVKEFECRKAADAYSRASTARTGVLDTARLHSYKYSEDLFKKVTVIPDGKNHGLVFILDWSGSMAEVLVDTCKQLFNLIWFCKKVSIPFEVYAFTNEWNRADYNYDTGKYDIYNSTPHYEVKEGLIVVEESFSLMNLLTSKVNGSELEKQMINIWRLANCFYSSYKCNYTYPSRLELSGTPLNESLICLHQILPLFQKENKLQKVQCIVLTDGEAPQLPYHIQVKRHWQSEPYMGTRHANPEITFLRDRKLGTTYRFEYGNYNAFTDLLLKNLRDKFPSVNFVGIRVLGGGRSIHQFVNLYHKQYVDKEYDKIMTDWKKNRSCIISGSGYHAYFGLSGSALSQDAEFEVKEDATKAQIKSAFAKSLKTKKLNKKVLGEFITLVA